MKTYTIIHEPSKTNFLTPDFMDVWNQIDALEDGETFFITVKEMTAREFEEEVKARANLNLSISTPWENGKK